MDFKSIIAKLTVWKKNGQEIAADGPKPFSEENMIEEAHQALIQAQNLFSRVEDPDMIEYAIYSMKAAEERFDYLVRTVKAQKRSEMPFPT